jgi:hypothetical protein
MDKLNEMHKAEAADDGLTEEAFLVTNEMGFPRVTRGRPTAGL